MYYMYPEWGPSRHNPDFTDGRRGGALQESLDLRDNGGQRPDDN